MNRVVAITFLLALAPQVLANEACNKAYDTVTAESSLQECRKAAEDGDSDSELGYALVLWSGHDRVSQPKPAIDWFRRAASHGNKLARVTLGRFLSDDRSPAEVRSLAEGYAWWVAAGENKSAADLKKRLSPSELAEGEQLAKDINELDRVRAQVLGLDDLQVLQRKFAENPNFQDCVVIFDRVGHILKQYGRSIEYGNRCLELPHESKNGDWLIHYWLAEFYNKNSDVEHSMFHLRLALKLDTKNTILKNNWLSQSGLEGIYAKIKP